MQPGCPQRWLPCCPHVVADPLRRHENLLRQPLIIAVLPSRANKTMDFEHRKARAVTRRTFFGQTGLSLGALALGSLIGPEALAAASPENPLTPKHSMLPGTAKSVIYMHMSGAPPTLDMFDYKPK